MAQRLAQGAEWVGNASLNGWLYHVDGYPGLVPGPDAPPVVGDLFRLHEPLVLLNLLDAYEEVGPEFPAPNEYRREIHPVDGPQGHAMAWVYIYARPVESLPLIVGEDLGVTTGRS